MLQRVAMVPLGSHGNTMNMSAETSYENMTIMQDNLGMMYGWKGGNSKEWGMGGPQNF